MKLLIMTFTEPPGTFPFVGPNIFLITLFMNILNLYSYFNVTDQVSSSFKTKGKMILLCILIFVFLNNSIQEDKMFWIT